MEELTASLEDILAGAGFGDATVRLASHAILAVMIALLAWIVYVLCYAVAVPLAVRIARRTEIKWDDLIFNPKTLSSACRIVPAVVIWLLLPPVFHRHPAVEEAVTRGTVIYIIAASMLLGISVVDSFKKYENNRHASLQQYYNTFCGVLKLLIIFLSVVVMAAVAIGRSPLALVAGLGATSAILMLVFKDTVSGLVAGIRLTSNDMLHKGDWITVPKADINGIVEEITLTTVKVRNFDNTILTISPLTLADGSFQNWAGMRQSEGRRVKRRVHFDFHSIRMADTELKNRLAAKGLVKAEDMERRAVNLTLFRNHIESYLLASSDVNSGMPLLVRQLEPADTGLPVEFYFFLHQKEWIPYEHQLAGIMEYVYAAAPEFGLRIYQRVSDR